MEPIKDLKVKILAHFFYLMLICSVQNSKCELVLELLLLKLLKSAASNELMFKFNKILFPISLALSMLPSKIKIFISLNPSLINF